MIHSEMNKLIKTTHNRPIKHQEALQEVDAELFGAIAKYPEFNGPHEGYGRDGDTLYGGAYLNGEKI